MEPTILYQDDDSTWVNPKVMVTPHGVKVGSDVHSLEGVLQVKLQTSLEHQSQKTSTERILAWIFFWAVVCGTIFYIASVTSHGQSLTGKEKLYCGGFPLFLFYVAKRMSNKGENDKHQVVRITLVRSTKSLTFHVGTFPRVKIPFPDVFELSWGVSKYETVSEEADRIRKCEQQVLDRATQIKAAIEAALLYGASASTAGFMGK